MSVQQLQHAPLTLLVADGSVINADYNDDHLVSSLEGLTFSQAEPITGMCLARPAALLAGDKP